MDNILKNLAVAFLIFLVLSGLFALYASPPPQKTISLNELATQINEGKIKQITIMDDNLEIELVSGEIKKSLKEKEATLTETLKNYGVDAEKLRMVNIDVKEPSGASVWMPTILSIVLPLLIIVGFIWLMLSQVQRGNTQAMMFGRSMARLILPGAKGDKKKVTFKDVAGVKEAKEELKEVVDFLKNPKKFLDMGARIPRGVLLMGAPGTGKTLLARAVAGEANVPFFSISGSEFVEMFVGVGASVTGDTPILIKTENSTKLLPIKEFVDRFYKTNQEGFTVKVKGVETLGAEWSKGNKFFKSSAWKKIESVYRHRVNEIYEINFLGGKIKVTGDHSIFVRDKNRIVCKKASELKIGDILVNLPFKVRSIFIPTIGTTHKIKCHQFCKQISIKELAIWNENSQLEKSQNAYEFALANRDYLMQYEIANQLGVSSSAVSLWQRGVNRPRYFDIASRYQTKGIPQKVLITPSLLKLLGYYTAEGRKTDYYLQFIFGAHEKEPHKDCVHLMKNVFNVEPHLEYTKDNTLRITYHSKYLAEFFEKYCGNGSHNKHLPEFIWDLPKEYFLTFLDGYRKGDGYITKEDKISITSVSKQLILELNWLCNMHGIGCGVREINLQEGRIIKNRQKPLPGGKAWNLIIGKTSDPYNRHNIPIPNQIKKPYIKKIIKKPYNDFVYDLCGCENEAFFGGEKPILLHNSRVRDLFRTAKKNAPCILFIDEIDAVGRQRGTGLGGGHDEREQTLNQILVEMDGFETDTNVIVVSATNRPDVLDPALLRPGRFDRRIVLEEPDIGDREEILKIHCRGKPLDTQVNLRRTAERTPGFSGADLSNLVNEAAILAARRRKKKITQQELIDSIEKVLLGPERKSHILSEREKKIAAYHEAGHALVAASLLHTDPIHKVSIISRGRAAGYTLYLPVEDKHLRSKSEFIDQLATLLGGFASEKLVFNELTTGAASDLTKASELARDLITKYGMSEKIGPVTFGRRDELVFLGRELGERVHYSEKVASEIDKEITRFIDEANKTAHRILTERRGKLDEIAKVLIEKESIERDEFEKLVGPRPAS